MLGLKVIKDGVIHHEVVIEVFLNFFFELRQVTAEVRVVFLEVRFLNDHVFKLRWNCLGLLVHPNFWSSLDFIVSKVIEMVHLLGLLTSFKLLCFVQRELSYFIWSQQGWVAVSFDCISRVTAEYQRFRIFNVQICFDSSMQFRFNRLYILTSSILFFSLNSNKLLNFIIQYVSLIITLIWDFNSFDF